MNISSSISYEPQYSKSESADIAVKQKFKQIEPVIKEKSDFKESMNKLEKKERSQDIIDIIGKSNKEFKAFDRKLEMSVHAKTGEVMIKVLDTITDEVIRELPPESVLDTVAYRREIAGILMDKKI